MDNQLPPSDDAQQGQESVEAQPQADTAAAPSAPGPPHEESTMVESAVEMAEQSVPTPETAPAPPQGPPPAASQPAAPVGQAAPQQGPLPPPVAQPSHAGGYQPPGGGYQPPGGSYPPSGGGQPPRRRSGAATAVVVILVLLALGAVSIIGIGMMAAILGEDDRSLSLGGRVGIISIEGVIMSGGRGSSLFGTSDGSRAIMQDLRAAAADSSVKAVVLHVNSPGGSAAASDAILSEVKALAEKKPVIACMEDVAASGGYYVACGADKIVANGSTLTGSIGVIMSGVGYYGLMEKVGLESQTITSGRYKDTGSPLRPMRADERELLQAMVHDVYEQFVDAVVDGRPDLTREEVLKLADGRILTGRQALEAGLVDEMGTYYDAIRIAAEEAGISGEPKLKTFGPRRGVLDDLMGTRQIVPITPREAMIAISGPMLLEPKTYNYLVLHAQPLAQAAGSMLAQ